MTRGFPLTYPEFSVFCRRADDATVVPLIREVIADWWTPVTAFRLLAGDAPNAFLLESVEGGERVGRYSFLGRRPYLIVKARGDRLSIEGKDAHLHRHDGGSPLEVLKRIVGSYRSALDTGLPPFISGAVGYFGYDTVRWIERLPPARPGREDDMTLLFLEDVLAFDHVRRRLYLVSNARIRPGDDPRQVYDTAIARLDELETELYAQLLRPESSGKPVSHPEPASNIPRKAFMDAVARAKEWIAAGDIFQVVLSQRFEMETTADDLGLYRALRSVNPSPYMFLLRLEDWTAVGSSPEPLLRIQGDRLTYRPIAGTISRTGDPGADERAAERLRNDPKERAEHVMLVDLGRNDLGRCAVSGSVAVDEFMSVERYSHVMHLVSGLNAQLKPGLDPLDALYACFPAGTVSGAPKIRAMEIIHALEPDSRGIYAGAVGYLDFSGNLDTCIALRTMVIRNGTVHIQAGAGIVADSDPAREYEETCHKARALVEAVALASNLRMPRK